MAEADKKRFLRETEEMKTLGYFITEDGTKSTDIKPELNQFPEETVFPKKPMTSMIFFFRDFDLAPFRKENEKMSLPEMTRIKTDAYSKLTE